MVKIGGEIDMYSLASNGIDLIKNALATGDAKTIDLIYSYSKYRN